MINSEAFHDQLRGLFNHHNIFRYTEAPIIMEVFKMGVSPIGSLPFKILYTLPETNSSPLKIGLPNRKVIVQPSIFKGLC